MKKNNKIDINKEDMYRKINNIPSAIVWILMLVLAPVGVWFFIIKKCTVKRKIYSCSRALTGIGLFVLFLIGVGIYSKIKEIIVLYDSGMSLDMINFIPDNLYLYIIGIIMCISFIIGGNKLKAQAKVEQVYTININLEHETSIKKLSDKLELSIDKVKDNIKLLQNNNYLIPLEIDNKKNKIIYKEEKETMVSSKTLSNNFNKYKTVQCPKCGAIIKLKLDEYVECDFCGNGLIKDNN